MVVSKFNIQKNLEEKIETTTQESTEDIQQLPTQHFSQQDIDTFWKNYLEGIKYSDIVLFSAINGFSLTKNGENNIEVKYPSESSLDKFSKIQADFLSNLKYQFQNYSICLEFKMDSALKKEIITSKNIFDKYIEINPLLKDLDQLVKFDFS